MTLIYVLIASILLMSFLIYKFKLFKELDNDFWLNMLITTSTTIGTVGILTLVLVYNFKNSTEFSDIFNYSLFFILTSFIIIFFSYLYHKQVHKECQYNLIYITSEYLIGNGLNGLLLSIILMFSKDSLLKDLFEKKFDNPNIIKMLNDASNIWILIISINAILVALLINSYMKKNKLYNKSLERNI
jgi:hypothetical protein